jgi:hypothetical protein
VDGCELRLNQVEWSAKIVRGDSCCLRLSDSPVSEINYSPHAGFVRLDAAESSDYPRDPGLIPVYPQIAE